MAQLYYDLARFQQCPCCAKKNGSQTVRPFAFAVAITDLIVANLDHDRGQGARAGMALDRVIDLVPRRIWLIDANRKGRVGLELADENIGQAAVLTEHDSDLPGTGLAEINRGIGMHRDERRRLPPGEAALKTGIDRGMIGGMDLLEPPRALRLGKPEIRWHGAPLALADDQAFRRRHAIAVDDQAGCVRPEQRSVESHREAPGDAERPGIPGDVGQKRVFGEPEGRIRVRDAVRGMIADEDERPWTVWIFRNDQAALREPGLRVFAR